MSCYNAEIEVSDGVTMVRVTGPLSVEMLVDVCLSDYYGQTTQACWDLRRSTMEEMTRQDFTDFSNYFKLPEFKRVTRAAAIVLKDRDDLLMFRSYTLIGTNQAEHTFRHFLTCNMGEAMEWLDHAASPGACRWAEAMPLMAL